MACPGGPRIGTFALPLLAKALELKRTQSAGKQDEGKMSFFSSTNYLSGVTKGSKKKALIKKEDYLRPPFHIRFFVDDLIEGDTVIFEQSGTKPDGDFRGVFQYVTRSKRHFHFANIFCESVGGHPVCITDVVLLSTVLIDFVHWNLLRTVWTWTIDM